MHLDSFTLTNFRSFGEETTVRLQPYLTVLAGENNAGKTNILEALRLFTLPVDGRQTRYPKIDDIRRGADSFTLRGRFDRLNTSQRALYITALEEPSAAAIWYGMRYRPPEAKSRRGRIDRWAGHLEGSEPEPEAREYIRHVHLPALRDAQKELGSGSPERIAFLLRQMASDEEELEAFSSRANTVFEKIAGEKLVKDAAGGVNDGFDLLTRGVQPHSSHLRPSTLELRHIARHLQFHLQRSGFSAIDLIESGLGYANLLFLSTVLVELSAADDADLTLFLVEEPEAHLHPQLQAATLSYLQERAEKSATRERSDGEPAGAIQVIVTTHSPNLASAVSSRHVVVIRSSEVIGATDALKTPPREDVPPPPESGSRVIAVTDLDLEPPLISRIDRYLDVTRAALFFSSRVLLVEGLAEALLLPSIAQQCCRDGILNDEQYARFRSATILAIDGVDFEPYVKLLITQSNGARIADKVVVITDGDPPPSDGDPETPTAGEDVSAGGRRASALYGVAQKLQSEEALHVFLSTITLEADLLIAGNREVIREAFLAMRPRSQAQFDAIPDVDDDPDAAGRALVNLFTSKRIRKGDFAQRLAEKIQQVSQFRPPEYLSGAITELVT